MTCVCKRPLRQLRRDKRECLICGRPIPSKFIDPDPGVREFFDRVEISFGPSVPTSYHAFRELAGERERKGRPYFGLRFLARDNIEDCLEELADAANYAMFDIQKAERETGERRDDELAYALAMKCAEAFDLALQLRAKRRGSP